MAVDFVFLNVWLQLSCARSMEHSITNTLTFNNFCFDDKIIMKCDNNSLSRCCCFSSFFHILENVGIHLIVSTLRNEVFACKQFDRCVSQFADNAQNAS